MIVTPSGGFYSRGSEGIHIGPDGPMMDMESFK